MIKITYFRIFKTLQASKLFKSVKMNFLWFKSDLDSRFCLDILFIFSLVYIWLSFNTFFKKVLKGILDIYKEMIILDFFNKCQCQTLRFFCSFREQSDLILHWSAFGSLTFFLSLSHYNEEALLSSFEAFKIAAADFSLLATDSCVIWEPSGSKKINQKALKNSRPQQKLKKE